MDEYADYADYADNFRNDIISHSFSDHIRTYIKEKHMYALKNTFGINLNHNKINRVTYMLDCLNIPKDLSFEERVAYYQLMGIEQ